MANNIFKTVKVKRPKRNTFNLSHSNSLTGSFGNLIPFMCEETIPGDTWKVSAKTNTIFAPLSCPCLTPMYASVHYFFVPFRLLNDDFEAYITGSQEIDAPKSEPSIELPCNSSINSIYADSKKRFTHGSLADYLNYPTSEENMTGGGMKVSLYPLRAYQRIYDEYYRDENQIPSDKDALSTDNVDVQVNTPEFLALTTLRKRSYAKDYFTSALPWTQKGPQQQVPVTGTASVVDGSIKYTPDLTSAGSDSAIYANGNSVPIGLTGGTSTPSLVTQTPVSPVTDVFPARIDNSKHLSISNKAIELAGMTFTINEFRRANAIQKWFERNARAGSRYVESLLSHFGVISSDARIQRPEFLGGSTTKVAVSDVIQTSASDNVTPQGNRAGLAYSFQSNGFTRTFEERGLIIGIYSLIPQLTYMEGLRKVYRKREVFDYYFPEFAHLGEQPIKRFEVALRDEHVNKEEEWGYTPRYSEYKFIPSTVHGDFKNMEALGDWTLARHYEDFPNLSREFIEVDAQRQDLDRIFAVQAESSPDQIMVNFDISVKARRPMPYLPEPSIG